MAVIGVGKSDLSSVMSEKEPRIQGRQDNTAAEGSSVVNTGATKSNTEKKEDKVPEAFSLASSGGATETEKKLAEGAKKASGKYDDKETRSPADDEDAALQSDDKPAAVSDQVMMTPVIVQDPLLLSRWAEFGKSTTPANTDQVVAANGEKAAVTSAKITADSDTGGTKNAASLLTQTSQVVEDGSNAGEVTTDAPPLKESNQQRLQAALLSRGSSLSSAMELLKARADTGSQASNTQTMAQHSASVDANPILTSRQEKSLSASVTSTLFASAADTSSSAPLSASSVQVSATTGVQGHEWSPVKLSSPQSQWGQQLVDTLKERVEMQSSQNIKQAHIRLDPPDLGKLELTVRIDGDKLSVQLNASNPAVRDALVQSSERLRMNLSTQHSGGVEVNVGQGDSQRQQQDAQEETILAGRRNLMTSESDAAVAEMAGLNALV